MTRDQAVDPSSGGQEFELMPPRLTRMLGGGEEADGRAVQIGACHRISAFDVAQRDVAGVA